MSAPETLRDLAASPVGLFTLTLAAYQLGRWLRDRTGGHALAQPVLVAVVVCAGTITLVGVEYEDYRAATEPLAFLLGPAVVALAVPLHRQVHRINGWLAPLLAGVVVGAVLSVASAVLLVRLLGGGDQLERTMAVKATTTPVALALAETVGGIPALAAALAIVAGILGAVAGPAVLSLARVRDDRARGLAIGAVSHGIGTSRSLVDDPAEGAFAGVSMGLTALVTALVLPVLAVLVL